MKTNKKLSAEDREYLRSETDPTIAAAYVYLVQGEQAFEVAAAEPVPADDFETRNARHAWAQDLEILAGIARNHARSLDGALWTNEAARKRAFDLSLLLRDFAREIDEYRYSH